MNADRPCSTCRHSHNMPAVEQLVCVHPDVAVASVVKPALLIGVEHSAVRYRDTCVDKPQCGPAGTWWEARAEA